ncbi:hypothetical protein SAMN04489802_4244 [Pseudomonas chlororaphis]|uniref:hypothetical protein n=1 Tax=Pseudomonas chlororaphis TaxID=587753 RepID=UPI00087B7775|nr:hypothetical protein [Pseudomonas chlororaphis]AZD47716.1 hypothetical protein C4K20_2301 [Pseudomonas chlororaphis subsp. aurantiaca]AZD66153.1 hypothetical protein C4K17_2267 [Pseudomonas chlororaphis subsp. aurantiaca]AZD72629.1 hypothetical protein C4K16_2269 [Pseudomonas chlororaphis subsp. aurantiaca]WDH06397.1 hypothetical protein PUP57_12170 [Pseudomonas chlororaphis]WDH10848.1 hypothetical protein PUP64_02610 [Pseudomonas chlororaphis]
MSKAILILCLALLTGCVGHYLQPAPEAAHATLNAQWGSNILMSGGTQVYYGFYDNHCHDTQETGVLGAISASQPEKNQFLIKPDRRIYLQAASMGIKNRNGDEILTHRTCLNISSFIPKNGAMYQVSHSAPKSGCSLEVIDMQTGKAPDSLVVEEVTKECGLGD